MAYTTDKQVGGLTASGALASTDVIPVQTGGTGDLKKATIAQLSDALSSGGGDPVTGFGDVVGPASSTDESVAFFNGTTGKLLKNTVTGVAQVTAQSVEQSASVNGNVSHAVSNASAGTSALASHSTVANVGRVDLYAYSSGNTSTQYGITLGSYQEILATGNGLLIGTGTQATPIVFGNNSTERLRIASTGAVTVPISVAVGGGTPLTKIIKTTATIDPASIAAGVVVEQTFTVTGVLAGDIIIANKPTLTANLIVSNVRASGTDQVAITFYNNNLVGANDPASETWAFLIVRS